MKNLEVVGIGALNVDHLFRVDEVVTGSEAVIREEKVFTGGSSANTIYALSRLGIKAGFLGAVGSDTDAGLVKKDFEKAGTNIDGIVQKKGPTGRVYGFISESGERSLYVLPGANSLLGDQDINYGYLDSSRIILVASFADPKQFVILKRIFQKTAPDVEFAFSPGAIYSRLGFNALEQMIGRSTLLFINESEIATITGMAMVDGVEKMIETGCKTVIVTRGEKGSMIFTEDDYIEIPARKVDVVDTTGAGDAYAAGFLYGYIKGKDWGGCGAFGAAAASLCISKTGAKTGLPDESQLLAEIDR